MSERKDSDIDPIPVPPLSEDLKRFTITPNQSSFDTYPNLEKKDPVAVAVGTQKSALNSSNSNAIVSPISRDAQFIKLMKGTLPAASRRFLSLIQEAAGALGAPSAAHLWAMDIDKLEWSSKENINDNWTIYLTSTAVALIQRAIQFIKDASGNNQVTFGAIVLSNEGTRFCQLLTCMKPENQMLTQAQVWPNVHVLKMQIALRASLKEYFATVGWKLN
jgi:hypothetical protein